MLGAANSARPQRSPEGYTFPMENDQAIALRESPWPHTPRGCRLVRRLSKTAPEGIVQGLRMFHQLLTELLRSYPSNRMPNGLLRIPTVGGCISGRTIAGLREHMVEVTSAAR